MKILCVTKCPTGMVQTYVAAEKLEQAGKKLGVDLSVETQGAMGIQNQFSPEQIDEADYIVIAADVAIDEASRFGNKKLYVTSLEDAIVHPEQILESPSHILIRMQLYRIRRFLVRKSHHIYDLNGH